MSKDLVKEQFGQAAASYAVSKVHAQGASLARLVEVIAPQPHWRVLDIATGAGHTAFAFAPHVAQVVATDITPEMLTTTARLAQEKGLTNLVVQEADAEALPFPDGEFDLVTCRIAPHHFLDVDRFVRESARVLRTGGILAVVDNIVPGGDEATAAGAAGRAAGDYINAFEKLRDPSHARCLSLEEWVSQFQQAGLTVLHQETQPKAIELIDWAGRMKSGAAQIPALRDRLLNAPPAVAAFLQPTAVGDDVHFLLAEGIVIGRK
jgi:ubiquinone/menaquinone biosynthesis C-methylase UbiE